MATKERPELVSSGAGLASAVATETHGELGTADAIRARGYWEGVWLRFRRDKFAIAGGLYILFVLFAGFAGGPIAAHFLGHGPNDQIAGGVDPSTTLPVNPWSHVDEAPYVGAPGNFGTTLFILGGDASTLGRDEFLRLLYGAQTSLEVAIGATILSMFVGVLMGALAGFYGGWTDTVISRITEIVMAFPILLFVIALASTVGPRLDGVTLGFLGEGVVTLVLVLGLFGWFYPARIVRAQVLSLREKEFVEAARMIGTNDLRIIRSHILPHLVAPIIVYSTLVVAQNILAEAGLSFLALGIKAPTASWGNMLSGAADYYTTQPWLMLWPGAAVLLATLAFNLLGDGLRDAFDPRSSLSEGVVPGGRRPGERRAGGLPRALPLVCAFLALLAWPVTGIGAESAVGKARTVQIVFAGKGGGRYLDHTRWLREDTRLCYARRIADETLSVRWQIVWTAPLVRTAGGYALGKADAAFRRRSTALSWGRLFATVATRRTKSPAGLARTSARASSRFAPGAGSPSTVSETLSASTSRGPVYASPGHPCELDIRNDQLRASRVAAAGGDRRARIREARRRCPWAPGTPGADSSTSPPGAARCFRTSTTAWSTSTSATTR